MVVLGWECWWCFATVQQKRFRNVAYSSCILPGKVQSSKTAFPFRTKGLFSTEPWHDHRRQVNSVCPEALWKDVKRKDVNWKAGQSRSAGDIKIFSTDQSWAVIHHYNTSLARQHENEIPSSKWSFDSCTNYSWIHQAIHTIPERYAGKFEHQHTKICSSGRAWTSPAHGSCCGVERSRPVVCRFFGVATK